MSNSHERPSPRTHHLASPSTRSRPRSTTPSGPSTRHSTQTRTQTLITPSSRSHPPADLSSSLVLRLRGSHTVAPSSDDESTVSTTGNTQRVKKRRQIQWAETVIDNEGLGRKKSKVCCIYHKPRAVGESSSEDDSSSSSDGDSDASSGVEDGARPVKGRTRRGRHHHDHNHNHQEGEEGGGDACHGHSRRGRPRKPSPNAYEKMPKYNVKPLEQQPG